MAALPIHSANSAGLCGKCKHWVDMTKAEQAAVETLGWTNEARTPRPLAPSTALPRP